ncbi:M23 family metallopeptidase [Pelagibacterium sediminicola]|uniref:M23 family metallopeptidase n=1 Tax=Pelagibacterium sediminicola TaxID=2248761 RepID=UPI001FEA3A38|nr:M23 family metallopeptidase [Pelagibacterium sediminicola]
MRSGEAQSGFGRAKPKSPQRGPHKSGFLFYALFALLLGTNAVTGIAFYYTPEINDLLREDNSAIITAYEQRIVQLRLEVDRLHSRQYAQMGDMNLQMHELVQQQEILAEQHEYVRALADMARDMGIAMGGTSAPVDTDIVTGAIGGLAPAETGDTAVLAQNLIAMQEETRMALASLSDAATLSTQEIVGTLETLGVRPSMPRDEGIGGPFIPADGMGELSIIEEANAVASALARFQSARQTLMITPVQRPVAGNLSMSSNFGNRMDPFLKRTAFHSGIDFRTPTGTPILAAAKGTVTYAGTNGGYGKMVDIDHGNGLVSRYAHMSAINVHEGQSIRGGERIGLAGSTGRSTGPHLHFEVRRGGSAVDPSRFITAGRTLAKFF